MDSHRHPPFAFHQLKDADVTLAELVVLHKLEKCQVPEGPHVGRVVVADEPLLFPVGPTKYDAMCPFLEMFSSKSTGDDLHIQISYFSIVLRVSDRV